MRNNYLYITEHTINFSDGVFSGIANREPDFFEEEAKGFRESDLMNYDILTKEQREKVARLWEKARLLPEGKYDYYFNLENKHDIFAKMVDKLAKELRIQYELNIL